MPKGFPDKKPGVVTGASAEQDVPFFQHRYGHPRTLIGALAPHAPHNIALTAPGRTPLTYQQLRKQVGEVGAQLHSFGVGSQDRVVIVLPNGPEMALSFLAVSSAATAAPLNPAYRPQEFDFFLTDLQAKFLIIQAGWDSPIRGVAHTRGIPIIELSPTLDAEAGLFTLNGKAQPDCSSTRDIHPDDIALLLHTSGTTARPKLIPLTHANLVISAINVATTLQLCERDRCLNVMPLFHIHGLVGALLASLANGGSLVCPPGFHALDFFDWLEAFRPTWYTAVPTMHQGILARATQHRESMARSSLRLIRSSSAPLPSPVMKELEATFHCPVIEAYGMTEAAHQMTSNPLPPGARKPGSVGVAAGPEVTILDDAGNVLSPGACAEVAIRGPNVMTGYDYNLVANQETFTNGWFRTGDQGYLDGEGYLFLTGRIKEQINRGGEKIAPREVDDVLLEHPAVAQAVTFAMPHSTLGEDVAAAVVLREETVVSPRELQEFVLERLADFKVPRRLLILPEIPKGPTGKLQRIGLAEKLGLAETDHGHGRTTPHDVEPRTWVESKLITVWSEVLRIPHVGLHDKFLELGGDSILATQILVRVREVMQVELSYMTFFESSTPAAMARNIEIARHEGNTGNDWSIKSVVIPTKIPLTFSQGRLWFLDQLNPGDVAYNRPAHFRLAGDLDIKALEQTINEIIRRHQALRTIFQSVDGEPFQVVLPELTLSLPIIDIRTASPAQREAEIEKLVDEESRQGFHLAVGPLVRGRLVRTDDEDHLLLLTFHHIVFDGWSEVILVQELTELYTAFSTGAPSPLPEVTIQYKDYALSQSQWFEGRSFDVPLSYWKKKLANQPTLNISTDHPRSPNPSFSSGRESLLLSRELSDGINDLGSGEGASLYMVVLAASQAFLSCYTGQEDVSVGTLVANRTQKETERLIGYFVNNLVLRTDLSGNPSFREILQRVRKVASEAYSYQDLPFEKVLQAVHPKRDPLRAPLFQVMVVYHNYPKMVMELPNLTISRFRAFPPVPTQYELTLLLKDHNECLACELTYRKDLFCQATIKAMLEQFLALLHCVVDDPTIHLLTLSNSLQRGTCRLPSGDRVLSDGPGGSPQLSAGENVFYQDSGGKHGPGPMVSLSKTVSRARATLSETKRVLLEKRLRGEIPIVTRAPMPAENNDGGISVPSKIPIPRVRKRDCLPLSFAQQRLWYLDQLQPGSSHYNIHSAFRLRGPLNRDAFQQSLDALVARHEVLRTRFDSVEGVPVQEISPPGKVNIPVIDLQQISQAERDDEINRLALEEARKPFDLVRDPLLRVTFLRVGDQRHILLLTVHHIVADGWSMGILYRELFSLYNSYSSGAVPSLPKLPIQYSDFAVWQRAYLQGEVLERELKYWQDKLANPSRFELHTDRPRPLVNTFSGSQETLVIPFALTRALKNIGTTEQATPFMVLLGVFQVLLARYVGLTDVTIGTPIAGRNILDIEPLIGFFVNTLVLRTDLSGNPSFREVLNRTRQTCLEAYNHQDLPFEKLVEELAVERDISRNPIFQIMFVLQNAGGKALDLLGLSVSRLAMGRETAKFDLTLSVREARGQFRATFVYNTDLFAQATIQRMLQHFHTLLEGIVVSPDQRIADLPMLTANERHQILREWNDTQVDVPNDQCLHQLIEQQVERSPNAVAVKFNDHQLTYAELNGRANQVAHYLRSLGVGPEKRVGICLERSPEMVTGMLSILKAGGVYVPLDPDYPKERLGFILRDADISILVTQSHLHSRLPFHEGLTLLNLDTDWDVIAKEQQSNLSRDVEAEHLAYIIYTSGSTGLPKGVMIPHRSLVNYIQTAKDDFNLGPRDRVLQFASISFDASAEEIYPCLTSGGTLVLRNDTMLDSWKVFLAKCQQWDLTVLDLPTAFWHELVAGMDAESLTLPRSVRLVIIGGERARSDRLAQWHNMVSESVHLVNTYGPTEGTIVATKGKLVRTTSSVPENSEVTLGKIIPNACGYLLDQAGQPVPIGVPGEFYLGGMGVARGYLNRPDSTAEKFLPDPFSNELGGRLYRTGDRARYRDNGTLQFVGRVDHQVKLRGYRIELGEIEAVLAQHPEVQEAVVVAREDTPGERQLVAYVICDSASQPLGSELRRFLQTRLPDYMVPAAFVVLEELPLNPNGKVDRRELPAPEGNRAHLEAAFVVPRTPIEQTLASIWQEVLGVERVSVYDNFFDLGGHSLASIQVIAKLESKLGFRLDLRDLLYQTLGQVAAQCTERLNQGGIP